jgi:hypothetical protein
MIYNSYLKLMHDYVPIVRIKSHINFISKNIFRSKEEKVRKISDLHQCNTNVNANKN